MLNIGIIGTGKLGTHLAESLMSRSVFDVISLHNRNKNSLSGRMTSLKLQAHLLGIDTSIQKMEKDQVNDLDAVIICVKDNYDPRVLYVEGGFPEWLPKNLRYVGVLRDLPIMNQICNTILSAYKGKIIVVTNPVEIMTYYVSKWKPDCVVVGLGATLDSVRVSYVIKEQMKIGIDRYSCVVAGEHGNDLIAVSGIWRKDPILNTLDNPEIENYLSQAKNIGFEIVEKIGFTLYDCAPVFADDIIWLLGVEGKAVYRSVAIVNNYSCISMPIMIENGKYILYKDYSQYEKNRIFSMEKRIKELINLFDDKIFNKNSP